MAQNINITLQKLANSSAKQIQDSVNKANMEGLKFNAQEAATARAWQEKMSKSSHQMEVADLKKAGLNPVLSANSGAQSYSTSAASGSVDSGANAFGSVMGSLMSTLAGLKQSEMSAQAQRYSADRNYNAAKISAEATKYSANQSAQAQKYAADQATYREMNKPQNNIVALLDKYFGSTLGKKSTNTLNNIFSDSSKLNWKNIDYKKEKSGNGSIVGKYTSTQKNNINSGLIKLGFQRPWLDSLSNKKKLQLQDLYFSAIVKGNSTDMQTLNDILKTKKFPHGIGY